MGARVEQPGEFLPCAGRARRCHLEDLADSLHRLPSAAEDLQVIIFRSNRALLLQGEFRITLQVTAVLVGWPFGRRDGCRRTGRVDLRSVLFFRTSWGRPDPGKRVSLV